MYHAGSMDSSHLQYSQALHAFDCEAVVSSHSEMHTGDTHWCGSFDCL